MLFLIETTEKLRILTFCLRDVQFIDCAKDSIFLSFFFFLANASFDPRKTHYIATGFYMPNAEDKGKKWLFGVLTCRCASKSTFADIAIKTLFDFHVSTSTSIMTLELRQKLVRWNYLPSIVMHDCICSELSFF